LEHFTGEPTDGGLIKKGAGTLTLNGANSYNGKTIVQAGTLQIAQATLATNSTVAISNSAVLQLDFGTTNQVAALVLNGASQPAGVYNNLTSPSFITGGGSLLVAPSVASNPTNLTFSASGGTISLSWPASHLGWILQAQTNSRSAGLSSNWFDVPGTASVTATNLSISPADPTVFFRLRYP
jgi:autotransporter-associated beta strand protein